MQVYIGPDSDNFINLKYVPMSGSININVKYNGVWKTEKKLIDVG